MSPIYEDERYKAIEKAGTRGNRAKGGGKPRIIIVDKQTGESMPLKAAPSYIQETIKEETCYDD